MRILLVEDDELLGSGLDDALARAHYAHEWVRDGRSALRAAESSEFDLVVLDLGLPQLDGMDVLRGLRSAGNATPVLILSARDATRDRVAGLNAGADDYLVKPFDLEELLARIHAIERRRSGGSTNRLRLGELVLDLGAMSVEHGGAPVELQRREFMLLKKLIENPNQVFSRGAARGIDLRLGGRRGKQHDRRPRPSSAAQALSRSHQDGARRRLSHRPAVAAETGQPRHGRLSTRSIRARLLTAILSHWS